MRVGRQSPTSCTAFITNQFMLCSFHGDNTIRAKQFWPSICYTMQWKMRNVMLSEKYQAISRSLEIMLSLNRSCETTTHKYVYFFWEKGLNENVNNQRPHHFAISSSIPHAQSDVPPTALPALPSPQARCVPQPSQCLSRCGCRLTVFVLPPEKRPEYSV